VLTTVSAPGRKLRYKISRFVGASFAEAIHAILPIGSKIVCVYISTWFEGSWFYL